MAKTMEELLGEVLADEARLAEITAADDPMARAVEVAREAGIETDATQIAAALHAQSELPDVLLAVVAGGSAMSNRVKCSTQ